MSESSISGASSSATSAASDAIKKGAAEAGAKAGAASKPPVYAAFVRMIGMPNFRFKLPSRNWSIFLSIVGSWTAAYTYDRREKKRILQKWSDRVSHLAREPLEPTQMPRSIRVVLGAPPGDGLLTAREHYHEYVKPILVSGGMDWEAVEGRKEGDVRAMIAEKIRETRIRAGESGELPVRDESEEKKEMVRGIREKSGVDFEGGRAAIHGDIVIGRNIWKEYVRGLHEGWLGPLTPPIIPEVDSAPDTMKDVATHDNISQSANSIQAERPAFAESAPSAEADVSASGVEERSVIESLTDVVSPANTSETTADGTDSNSSSKSQAELDRVSEEKKKAEAEEEEAKKKNDKAKRKQPPPFMSTSEYANAPIPPSISRALGPSVVVPLPHILGFLNTPIRMYRFLNQRALADHIGQQVASAVLAAHVPYQQVSAASGEAQDGGPRWEQEDLFRREEDEWHSSVLKKADANRAENKESLWVDDMVVDNRIAAKMRKFILPDAVQQGGFSGEMS